MQKSSVFPTRDIGPPHCPRHKEMVVDLPAEHQMGEVPVDGMANEPATNDAGGASAPLLDAHADTLVTDQPAAA